MKHSFYSRTRDDNKIQITIYKKYYKSYKKNNNNRYVCAFILFVIRKNLINL